ncbi:MAG: LEPR-XLL domain-containing protein [Planctomycetes bacterium]|nr:LEPR-XLL domain-containing protein [Planctomycetota bacterium]
MLEKRVNGFVGRLAFETLESRLLLSAGIDLAPGGPAVVQADSAIVILQAAVEQANEAPVIEHVAPASWPVGQDLSLEVRAIDTTNRLSAIHLYYRVQGAQTWLSQDVWFFGGGPTDTTEVFVLPGSEVVSPAIEYYIEAVDDQGLSGFWPGSGAENPYVLAIVSETIEAQVDIGIQTLNLASKGKWITVLIEFPADSGVSVEDVSLESLSLNGVPAVTNTKYGFVKHPRLVDRDGDGLVELMVKFDRKAVLATLTLGEDVELELAGLAGGVSFQGTDTVQVITPKHKAAGGQNQAPKKSQQIRYTTKMLRKLHQAAMHQA